MPRTDSQSTGELKHDGQLAGTCYSGIGAGLNNPAMEASHNIGPTPRGTYTIGPPSITPTRAATPCA